MDLRATRSQLRRAHELLQLAGDVWAALIDMNTERFRRGAKPVMGFAELCRELTGTDLGPLARICAEQVARNYSDACMATAKRKKAGETSHYPRRKRRFYPVRFRYGAFGMDATRVRLATAAGHGPLILGLSRPAPYPPGQIRAVTLCAEAGRLYLEVTAECSVEDHGLDPARSAGVDIGIIHPFAVVAGEAALLVSGRALRAEERLHLSATKARQRKMSPRQPRWGQRGSRRWRKLRAAQRKAEVRHRTTIRQAHHEAAKEAVAWAVSHRVGTLVVGDLAGIEKKDSGRHHNRRTSRWRRGHLLGPGARAPRAAAAAPRRQQTPARRSPCAGGRRPGSCRGCRTAGSAGRPRPGRAP